MRAKRTKVFDNEPGMHEIEQWDQEGIKILKV